MAEFGFRNLAGDVPEAGDVVVVEERPLLGEEGFAARAGGDAPRGAAEREGNLDGAPRVDDVAHRVGGDPESFGERDDLAQDRLAHAAHVDVRRAVDEAAEERLDRAVQM